MPRHRSMAMNAEEEDEFVAPLPFWQKIINAPEELWKGSLQQPPGLTAWYPDPPDASDWDANAPTDSNVLSYPSTYGNRPGPGHTAFASNQWCADSRSSRARNPSDDTFLTYPTNNVMDNLHGSAVHGDRTFYYELPSTAAGIASEHRSLQYIPKTQAGIPGGIVRQYQQSEYASSHRYYLVTPQPTLEQALSAMRLESPPPSVLLLVDRFGRTKALHTDPIFPFSG
ncbi:hypothetical protein NLJ89_g10099 [Agrocybe chaxingu]|uniref:Uncharacterized protein n=1 Tax=Agrocybe chaxingu TaxID=84603 RepID=A0A9W8JRZ1_9AGAR|nr:hypothetical protein NLJ89_g10099 [Agrocybe chaxingu]